MKIHRVLLASLLPALLCCAVAAPPDTSPAREMRLARADDSELTFSATDDAPPRIVVHWKRQMPTPGWTFEVDEARVEADRISVAITETRPDGMVAQVISPATVEIPLGEPDPGVYMLEIRTRQKKGERHMPARVAIVVAR